MDPSIVHIDTGLFRLSVTFKLLATPMVSVFPDATENVPEMVMVLGLTAGSSVQVPFIIKESRVTVGTAAMIPL
jgi:hypothetical protein